MNKYTEQEVTLLAKEFDSSYPLEDGYNAQIIERCLVENQDPNEAIKEFLGYRALTVKAEEASNVFDMVFCSNLNSMPCFINDEEPWKVAIAKWRMQIGK
jgi:L-arabinose isomerase